MEGDPTFDTILWVLLILLLLLHLLFAAGMAAVSTLGNQMGAMAEKHPEMAYYQKQKTPLLYVRVSELIFCMAGSEVLAMLFAGFHGWIPFQIAVDGGLWLDPLKTAADTCAQVGWKQVACIAASACVGFFAVLLTDAAGRGIGRRKPEQAALKMLPYLKCMMGLLWPLRKLYAGINHCFGGKHPAEESITEEDILHLVNAGNESGILEEQQREMINNIFEFDDIPISDVMTHRKELVAVDVSMEIAEVVELARSENYSRMPVYQDNIDNIVGVLNAKDLLGLIGCTDISGFRVRHFLREALFVPETAKCDDVLSEMSRKKMQMAIVVDEYGGTAGVVCMEDILEEIVGNIQDEYDEEEQEVRRLTDTLYIIDGHADPEDVLPLLGETQEEMPFDTMSGFLVDLLGRIPETHENPVIEWHQIRFTALVVEENWIAKIKAELLPGKTEQKDGEKEPDNAQKG